MVGRKPIEKRLMKIEDGIEFLKEKACEKTPYEPKKDDAAVAAEDEK